MYKNGLGGKFGGAFWQNCGASQVRTVGNTGLDVKTITNQ